MIISSRNHNHQNKLRNAGRSYHPKPFGCILYLVFLMIISTPESGAQGRYGDLLPDHSMNCTTSISGDLYSGIDNHLLLNTEEFQSPEKIWISSTNGIAVFDTLNRFLVIPEKPGKVRYTLYLIEGIDSTLLGYRFYSVRRVPEPRLRIDQTLIPVHGQVSKSLLMYCDSLSVFVSDDIPGSESWFTVREFTLGYNYGGFHVSYVNPSGSMLMETRKILNTLGPDREISIKATMVSHSGIEKELPIYRMVIY